jgi:phosphoesterase RecJ-like protein
VSEYHSSTELREIAQILKNAKSIVVTAHAKPDGDAYGAVTALTHALNRMGKVAERWLMPPIPRVMTQIDGDCSPVHLHECESDPLPEEADAIVICDTGAWSQLLPMRYWLEPRGEKLIVIDHHLHGDVEAAHRFVDPDAPATCSLVAELIDHLGVVYDLTISRAIYAGLATDTGWFRFSNTTPDSLRLAARLMEAGVDHAGLYQAIEMSERPEKLALMARALGSLRVLGNGQAAILTLSLRDFEETGAQQEETERIIDMPQVVGRVRIAALITEMKPNLSRLSFRTKPGNGAIDANVIARTFGGGGHARAAGAKLEMPLEEVQNQVAKALAKAINSS